MENLIYGVILAGGQGTRMGNSDKPKQFLEVGGRPVLIHTVEKFAVNPDFYQIIVLAPKQWLAYTKDIIRKYIRQCENIVVIEGGNTRNETIMNVLVLYEADRWVVFVFPREKHRPACYTAEGEANLLSSPASVDLGGVFITPVEKDFLKITAEDVAQILSEVCLSATDFHKVRQRIREKI